MKNVKRGKRSSNVEWRTCGRKKSYASTAELRRAAERMREFYGGFVDVHGYVCRFCGKFHLTTRSVTERQLRESDELVF